MKNIKKLLVYTLITFLLFNINISVYEKEIIIPYE